MRNPYLRQPSSNTPLIAGIIAVVCIFSAWLALIGAWLTHVVVTIQTASWVLLVVGAFIPPIGIIHGFMIWFGLI